MLPRASWFTLFLALSAAAVAWPAILVVSTVAAHSAALDTSWKVLKVGGGGWLTGIDISPDGSVRLVRADTYGAYRWSEAQREWRQLVTVQSMPDADAGVDRGVGVYEIRVAPSQPNRLYMAYSGYVYRSDDGGAHWKLTTFVRTTMDANDAFRTFGPKMAVDPTNPDVVVVGTARSGLFVTEDGGRTWKQVRDVPLSAPTGQGDAPGITGIAFDRSSGAIAGKTRAIYAASYGHGVYRTTDAGASWSALPGGPRGVSHAKIAGDGIYYAVSDDGSSIWRHDGKTWTNITPNPVAAKGGWSTVVVDPFNSARVLAVKEGGSFLISLDRGDSWREDATARGIRRQSSDVPWLAWTQESFMSVGDMVFDPKVPNSLWFAEGIGVWRANLPAQQLDDSPVVFISQTAGIEQLVANQIIAPPGGKPVLASWDRPVFYIDDSRKYPAQHGPDNQRAIVMGWALDYAPAHPNFLVGLFNWWGIEKSGYSSDGGRSWIPFSSYPPEDGKIGGGIAASTMTNLIWAPSNNAIPYFTKDGGSSWKPILLPGVPQQGETGWGNAYYLNRHIVAADRVSAGTFYLYNYLKGLYRSRDGGASWTQAFSGQIAPYSGFNAELRAEPSRAGHLFFTSGPQGGPDDHHPAPNPFMRSIDGGATWMPVTDVLEARTFGFGKGRGQDPAIYVVGWVGGQYGIWRSEDDAASWAKIGDFPLGILDHVTTIEGDGSVADRVYVGFGGAGYAYDDQKF